MLSNNVIVQTLAKCCYVSIVALCDVYKFTVKVTLQSGHPTWLKIYVKLNPCNVASLKNSPVCTTNPT